MNYGGGMSSINNFSYGGNGSSPGYMSTASPLQEQCMSHSQFDQQAAFKYQPHNKQYSPWLSSSSARTHPLHDYYTQRQQLYAKAQQQWFQQQAGQMPQYSFDQRQQEAYKAQQGNNGLQIQQQTFQGNAPNYGQQTRGLLGHNMTPYGAAVPCDESMYTMF